MTVTVPECLKNMFSELQQWRQCARCLYYREIDGKKYGVVLATIAPSHNRPAMNKPEIERVLACKRKGKIDEGYVVAARLNGSGYEYLVANHAEIVAKRARPSRRCLGSAACNLRALPRTELSIELDRRQPGELAVVNP